MSTMDLRAAQQQARAEQQAFAKQKLLAAAAAVDDLVGYLIPEGCGFPAGAFRRDMRHALSSDPQFAHTVEEVLGAMHNWSVMAYRRSQAEAAEPTLGIDLQHDNRRRS